MPISNMKNLLKAAAAESRALGSFTVGNMEMVVGAIAAAEAADTPIVIQIAEARLSHSPLPLIGQTMLTAAQRAAVPIGVHLDHGHDIDIIRQALDMGFTSVMFDGSALPLEENIVSTAWVVELAKQYGASVEAELGVVGGDEEGDGEKEVLYTAPADVQTFCAQTNVDALAVAIGNAHGNYRKQPALRFDILDAIRRSTATPLVLHGGSGISDAEFRNAIDHGISKINIATAAFNAMAKRLRDMLASGYHKDYHLLNEAMVSGAQDCISHHILVFNNVQPLDQIT